MKEEEDEKKEDKKKREKYGIVGGREKVKEIIEKLNSQKDNKKEED